jgi:hypothetical protein
MCVQFNHHRQRLANFGFGQVARFDHVRVKREAMLSKFAQVTERGEYVQPPHSKLSYGGVSSHVYLAVMLGLIRSVLDDLYSIDVCLFMGRRYDISHMFLFISMITTAGWTLAKGTDPTYCNFIPNAT